MKLTDTHLVILNVAAQRDDGSVLPFAKSLKLNKGSVARVVSALLKHKLLVEKVAPANSESWREAKDGQRFALFITQAGRSAVGIDAEQKDDVKATAAKPKPASRRQPSKPSAKPTVREGTKLSSLVALLQRKSGATIEEAAKATGWQVHSVRGAISGALKKKFGLMVNSTKEERRGRVYRIAARA